MKKVFRSQLRMLKGANLNGYVESTRRRQDTIGRFMARSYKNDVFCDEISLANCKCAMLTPKKEQVGGVVLYLHGGGYTTGNLNYAKGFGTLLAAKFGVRVLCVEYRLAPEHIFPAALDDSLDAYGYLLSNGYSPSQILLCGESAGGGLCYSLCQKLNEKGRTLPAGIIAISPWTDLTAGGYSYKRNAEADPSMTCERLKYYADMYVYGAELSDKKHYVPRVNEDTEEDRRIKSDPRMSPLFGCVDNMPPSLIFVGADEIMLDDALGIHGKLRRSGCESEIVIAPEMWHGYLLYGMKENASDMDKLGRYIKSRLGGQKNLRWLSLDNAAKIFPASRRRNWNNIFRLSATLTENVDRRVLKTALDVTIRRFPSIAVRIKTGMFWYYLEEIPKAPEILDEKPYPLSGMSFGDIKKCAFRVLVYNNRIAIEFYHALTDGTGALVFLKTLLAEYYFQKEGLKIPCTDGVLDRLESPAVEEVEDCFFKYEGPSKALRDSVDAYRFKGRAEPDGFKTNTTFIIGSDDILADARRRGVTVTTYLAAVLTVAAMRVQDEYVGMNNRRKPVKIHIPVNLRKIFPSETLRNFFLYFRTMVDPRLGEYTFDEICNIIARQMALEITEKKMAALIAANVSSEKKLILRITPLFLKNIVMKSIFLSVGERKSSFSLSNLGVVKLPKELEERIERFDFVLGVQSSAPYNTSAVSYGGRLYLNVIRNVSEPVLERQIYNVLRELGLEHTVESNTRGGK